MAVEAAPYLEMSFSCFHMAFIARCDRFLHFRWMANVAAHAGDAPMFSPGRCYVLYLCGMTLHAVIFCVRGVCPGGSIAVQSKQDLHYPKNQEYHDDHITVLP
jgi:hypothetical protein